MTMYIETTRPVPFGAIFSLNVVNSVDATFSNIMAWNAARKTVKALNALSTSQLEDIGVQRAQIGATAATIVATRY